MMDKKITIFLLVSTLAVVRGGADESYYHSESEGLHPVVLSGFAEDDFRKHGLTAQVCVCEQMPQPNILQSWKKLGVKMLRRAAWDPEGSAEFFRRQAGFLPFAEGADGVWLEGEKAFPETWKRALAEAKIDLSVARYLDLLADEALKHEDHHLVLEGRRIKWMFDEFDFRSANLDRLRLEFVAYAKYLEQKLGKLPRNLPVTVPPPIEPDVQPFTPCEGMKTKKIKTKFELTILGYGAYFRARKENFEFLIPDKWLRYRLKFYIPNSATGAYVPYEYLVDLSDREKDKTMAPVVGKGLFSIEDRFGGVNRQYQTLQRRSWSRQAPEPVHLRHGISNGWLMHQFYWLDFYGFWPTLRDGVSDKWYLIVDRLDGNTPLAFEFEWEEGATTNFTGFAAKCNNKWLDDRYKQMLSRTQGLFSRAAVEARYGCTQIASPTFQLFDSASDTMFLERCLNPCVAANAELAKNIHVPNYLKGDVTVCDRIWHALDRLLYFEYDMEAVRRDYLALRLAGKEPKPATIKAFRPEEVPVNKNGYETNEQKFWE